MATRGSGRKRLGRGLSSLITAPAEQPTSHERKDFFECPVEDIAPMRAQPRQVFDKDRIRELADSIRESGIIQPLVVRQGPAGRFVLVAGERRFRAAQLAGLTHVPVVVREVHEKEAFALALIENIQRENLNPIEEANAYQHLIDEHQFSQAELGKRVGKNRTTVANTLRLLGLSRPMQDLVAEGELSAGHARTVLSVPEAVQSTLAERIITEGLSVRAAEELARSYREAPEQASDVEPQTRPHRVELRPQLRRVQQQLVEQFGVKVKIKQRNNGSGTLEFSFSDDDDLKGIIDRILEMT